MSLNDFEIGKELGKGAFGSVYIVKRKQDNKIYAMKQVKIIGLSKKEKNNAFNEVRILASLSHKNIIGYKEAFYDNNTETLNIVMEYADDGDLNSKIKEYIKNKKCFEENIIWKTLIQILEGLKYLHKNCIIHRDLKSANIFLTKKGIIKIGDLNVSKIIKRMGMASTQTGTPYFASPEIWNNKPYDYKCDIWAVGCIIYEMAKLYLPFRAGSMRELYNNIMRGLYQPISLKYSHDLKKIIKKIIVVNPELRPSANELLNCEIIKKKMKELNMENSNDNIYELLNNFEEENPALMNTIKIPINMNQINKKLPKKKYEIERKINYNEIMLKNNYENSKNNNNYYSNNIINDKINNNIQKEKDNINYNLDNISHNNNNRNQLKDNNFKSDWNTNNFISKIFRNKILKINQFTNLINNNYIIINNDDSIINNNTIDTSNNNSNNIFVPNYAKNSIKKHSMINKKNSIPYHIPRRKKKIQKVGNKLDLLNSPKYNNSIKLDIYSNLDNYNANKISHNNNIFQIYNNTIEMNNYRSSNGLKENDKVLYHKRFIGKRSFSSNNIKNQDDKNNKNNSLKINIPKNGRNMKRKILKQYYSQSNIYNNSLISNDKNNDYKSIYNENESYSKNELDSNHYKSLIKKNIKDFIGKQRSIITDRNNFNNLLNRNKNQQLRTLNTNINRNNNIYNAYELKNNIGNSENIIKTDDNFNSMKKESSLKFLNELNNFPINSERFNLRIKKKKLYLNKLHNLFNMNTINNSKEEKIYGKRNNSYKENYYSNYTKDKAFNDNKSFGNIIDLNNISKIYKNKINQEENKTEISQIKLKEKEFLGKILLPKPHNRLNNKYKAIVSNYSYSNIKSNILNNNNKNMNNLYELKLDLLEFNDNKDKTIANTIERNHSNYKNKIPNNKYSNKNHLHKIFFNKVKMNNITERECYDKFPEIINKNDNYYYNEQYKSLIRNNSESSKQFSRFNKQNLISRNMFI